MRNWYKYFLLFGEKESKNIKKHDEYFEFEQAMGGYESNEYYSNKNAFEFKYLHGRFKYYAKYLNKNINPKMKILSIASGRCINELQFIDKDYNITCSDLAIPASYNLAKKIFKDYDFKILDILKNYTNEKYDCILSLGLVYAFSENEFKKYFNNVNKSLNLNGELILDSSSSSNNVLTFIYDRLYLKLENMLISKIFNFLGKKNSIASRHHGYKFTNNEVIKIAEKSGFELISFEKKDYLTEILRSKIVSKIIKVLPPFKYFFVVFGSLMPYLRFFKFRKIKNFNI
jgi:hypothetical protein